MKEHQLGTKMQYICYVVEVICRSRDLPMPSFNFFGCPDEEENQLAHYHPDSNTICISKRQLNLQSFDELRDTMVHEVAHILECEHGDDFSKECFINNLFVGELSVEAFLIESGKGSNRKGSEIIEIIVVKIGTEELRFRVPGVISFVKLSRDVTKAGDLGKDIKYIIKNRELDVKGEGSTELRARNAFQEDFKKLCYWCMLGEETVSKSIQKSKLHLFLDKENKFTKGKE